MKTWYLIHTKPRQETVAEANLVRQSFETYLPRIRHSRRSRGKWSSVVEPLFPRYLFIRLELGQDNIAPIRSTLGVTRLVSFGAGPAVVPEVLIEALQAHADPETGVHTPDRNLFEQGGTVRILDGPFAGLSGIFQETKAQNRALILLDILGRAQRLELPLDQLWPVHA
jgi:transcriptional antiterminator RfaH